MVIELKALKYAKPFNLAPYVQKVTYVLRHLIYNGQDKLTWKYKDSLFLLNKLTYQMLKQDDEKLMISYGCVIMASYDNVKDKPR